MTRLPASGNSVLPPPDEGGLRPPPGLSFWQRAWWWFDFLILVKLARLRFVAILVVIGLVITQWDWLIAHYEKWTRPVAALPASEAGFEWFCPMHPAIVRDNPREKCPICFMPLSKRKQGDAAEAGPLPAGIVSRVQLSPYRIALAGASASPVEYVPLSRQIVAAGLVEFNERGQKTVAARMSGRIDELLVSETGQMVEAGDVLASIYSPNLVVTVENMLQAQKSGNQGLLGDARSRLELLGIDRPQLDELLRTGRANTHLKIRSPISGHVIQKYVREGQYVEEGMPLYDVADLSTVWIQAQIYEDDIALLPTAQDHPHALAEEKIAVAATTRAFPSEEFHGRLRFIYPHVDQVTRTLSVRCEIDNPEHKLRPGGTATVKLLIAPRQVAALAAAATSDAQRQALEAGRVLAVPPSAVIDTGEQTIVYREATPGVFEGVRVVLGPKMTGPEGLTYFPVLEGVEEGQRIVTSGSFLVDAETRLNPAAGSIYFGGSTGGKTATSAIRPTTPEDPEAKIAASLAKLSPADRALAQQQRTCPVQSGSRLGSMGAPLKLQIAGQTVFLCCAGCLTEAQKDPDRTARRAQQLREQRPRSESDLPPAAQGAKERQ